MSTTSSRGADPALMRQINAVVMLRALRGAGPLTLAAVRARTGLSRSTVESVVDELVARQQVEEMPAGTASGRLGRPARLFRFRAEAGHVLGLDISAHHVIATVADLDGTTRAEHREATTRSASRADRLAAARLATRRCLAKAKLDRAALHAAAAGTLGIVHNGVVTVCRVLPEWNDFDLGAHLGGWLECPLVIENDINLSAIAERWRGAAADSDNLAWVSVGRSFAAGVMLDGRLFRGEKGAAGEFGWVKELGWSDVLAHPLASLGVTSAAGRKARHILGAAGAGEHAALTAVDEFAALLAPGLSAIVLAYNPGTLIIGGPAAAAGDLLLDRLERHLTPRCLAMPKLGVSTLGDRAVVTGAVRLALDQAERALFALDRELSIPIDSTPAQQR